MSETHVTAKLPDGKVIGQYKTNDQGEHIPIRQKSVLQDWVIELGLRHQGVLLTIVRGCDTVGKHDSSKILVRFLRSFILNAHCGDPNKASTFIKVPKEDELKDAFLKFKSDFDHYPIHYVMHLIHALEVLGYKYLHSYERALFLTFYQTMVLKLHLNPETEAQMDKRLNADEDTFAKLDRA